jgi:hypothetical protein
MAPNNLRVTAIWQLVTGSVLRMYRAYGSRGSSVEHVPSALLTSLLADFVDPPYLNNYRNQHGPIGCEV